MGMRAWFAQGYFVRHLQVRLNWYQTYYPLETLFPDWETSFAVPPNHPLQETQHLIPPEPTLQEIPSQHGEWDGTEYAKGGYGKDGYGKDGYGKGEYGAKDGYGKYG